MSNYGVQPVTDRSSVIAKMKEQKEELYRQLNAISGITLVHGWVVMLTKLNAVRFTYAPDGGEGDYTNPTVCRVTLATRMTQEVAERVAAKTFNGTGEVGEAVHIRTALARQIDSLNECIGMLEVIN